MFLHVPGDLYVIGKLWMFAENATETMYASV